MKICFLALGILIQCLLRGQDYFSKYYTFEGGTSNFRTILVDRDTILLEGIFVNTVSPFLQGIAFARMDSSGNLISYERYFDPKGRDLTYPPLNNMIKLSGGGYLVPAQTFQDEALLLIFLDPQFIVDTVFEYFAGETSVRLNLIRSVFELDDGYIVFGSAQRLSFATDGQIFRIRKNGELVWRKWYGLANKDEAFGDVVWYKDSTFVIGSFHKLFPVSSANKHRNTWIFQVDLNGNILNEFVDPDLFSGSSGGLVIGLNKNIYYSGAGIIEGMYGEHNSLGRIGMLNENFELQWKTNFGKNISLNTGCPDMILSRGSLIAIGTVVDTFTLSPDNVSRPHLGWTIMTNLEGDSICERTDTTMWYSVISASGSFLAMDTLSSGNILACGSGRFGQEKDPHEYAWLVKMPNPPCENLISKTSEVPTDINYSLQITPNPAKDYTEIIYTKNLIHNAAYMLVFNMDGKIIERILVYNDNVLIPLDLTHYIPGTYIVQLISKGGYLIGFEELIVIP